MSSSPVASRETGNDRLTSSQSDKQLEALRARQAELDTVVAELQIRRDRLVDASHSRLRSDQLLGDDAETRAQTAVDAANIRIKAHIKQLQDYNDIKDVGTQLMGLIAEKRGVRIVEVQDEFGIEADD